jgi:hypothetical protein
VIQSVSLQSFSLSVISSCSCAVYPKSLCVQGVIVQVLPYEGIPATIAGSAPLPTSNGSRLVHHHEVLNRESTGGRFKYYIGAKT